MPNRPRQHSETTTSATQRDNDLDNTATSKTQRDSATLDNTATSTTTTATQRDERHRALANMPKKHSKRCKVDVWLIYKKSFGRKILRPEILFGRTIFRPNDLSAELSFGRKRFAGKKISGRPNFYTQIESAVIAPFDLTFIFSAEK
jgi:hypothetical protein